MPTRSLTFLVGISMFLIPAFAQAATPAFTQFGTPNAHAPLFIPTRKGQVKGAYLGIITQNLSVGSTGSNVITLQTGLLSLLYSIPSGITGYFGQQTKAAVIAWQTNNHVSPASGFFGPKSRSVWNNGAGTIGATPSTTTSPPTTTGPAPTLTFTISTTTIPSGGSYYLAWSTTNATNCADSGSWAGTEVTQGSRAFSNVTSPQSYTLTCTGTGGSVTKTVSVTIQNSSTPTPTTPTPTPTPTPSPAPTPSTGTLPTVNMVSGTLSGAQNTTVNITYNWVGVPMSKNYTVFVHFADANGNVIFQDDHVLPNGLSTQTWSGPVSYTLPVTIPATAPVGTYKVMVGLYDATVSTYPKQVLNAGPGVIAVFPDYLQAGTFTVTAGTNLPLTPTVPAPITVPVLSAVPGAGDPLGVMYTDDHHPSGMTLAFHDEFDNSSLNTSTWANSYAWGDRTFPNNAEQECYLEGNVSESAGAAVLTAKQQPVVCPKVNTVLPYTSGLLNSQISYVQTYGYFVMRAKLPKGQGMWPAFWLLPADNTWPPELDVMEMLGNDPTTIYTTYHFLNASGAATGDGLATTGVNAADGNYHLFAVDWEPGSIKWYEDGVLVHTFTGSQVYTKPMYILANLAVGGSWGGNPDSTTVFPSTMTIDYIRAYK